MTMTDAEWQQLVTQFQIPSLLVAVEALDRVRNALRDHADGSPPQLRTDLLRLQVLSLSVIHHGARDQAPALFELAGALEDQISAEIDGLEQVRAVLLQLTQLHPDSLVEAALDDETADA